MTTRQVKPIALQLMSKDNIEPIDEGRIRFDLEADHTWEQPLYLGNKKWRIGGLQGQSMEVDLHAESAAEALEKAEELYDDQA